MSASKDKKLALIFLGVFFLLAIAFVWAGILFVIFLYNSVKVLPGFFDEIEDLIGGII